MFDKTISILSAFVFTVTFYFTVSSSVIFAQPHYNDWSGAPQSLAWNPSATSYSAVGNFSSPGVFPCGFNMVNVTSGEINNYNGVGFSGNEWWNMGSNGNFQVRFNRMGWNFVAQSYGALIGSCDDRVHPVYVYNPTTPLSDWSRFYVSGSICGTSNTDITLNMQDPNPLFKYKIDVVEVTNTGTIVANGLNWTSNWLKNFDKYVFPNPTFNNTFHLVPTNSPLTGKNVFKGVNIVQGKRYKISLSHEYPFNLPSPNTNNIRTTTTYIFCCSAPPSNLKVSNRSYTSATLNWTAPTSGADNYRLRYKLSTATTWTTVTVASPNTSYTLTGLTPNATYNWQVEAVCLSGGTGYKAHTFNTSPNCVDSYETNNTQSTAKNLILGLSEINLNALINTATDVDWFKFTTSPIKPFFDISLSNLPYNYNMELYRGNTLIGSSQYSGTTSEYLDNHTFQSGATYYIKIFGINGVYSAFDCYSLQINNYGNMMKISGGTTSTTDIDETATHLEQNVPNPFSDKTRIAYELPQNIGKAQIIITDLSGKLIKTIALNDCCGEVEVSAHDLSDGTFIYSLVGNGKVLKTNKMVVVKN